MLGTRRLGFAMVAISLVFAASACKSSPNTEGRTAASVNAEEVFAQPSQTRVSPSRFTTSRIDPTPVDQQQPATRDASIHPIGLQLVDVASGKRLSYHELDERQSD